MDFHEQTPLRHAQVPTFPDSSNADGTFLDQGAPAPTNQINLTRGMLTSTCTNAAALVSLLSCYNQNNHDHGTKLMTV